MGFDGDEFVGIDEFAASDDTPHDTWLEHRLQGNALYTLRGHDAITYSPKTGSTALDQNVGDRPYVSLEWSTLLIAPYVIQTTLEAIEVGLIYSVRCQGSPNPAPPHLLRIEVHGANGRVFGSLNVELEDTSGGLLYRPTRFKVELASRPTHAQLGKVIIWQRSALGPKVSSTPIEFGMATYEQEGEFTHLENYDQSVIWSTPPDDEALIGAGFVTAPQEPTRGTIQRYDLLSGLNWVAQVVPGPQERPLYYADALFYRQWLTTLRVKGLTLRDLHDLTRVEIPPSALRANIAVLSEATLGHPRMADLAHDRERCQWLGPPWTMGDPEEDSPYWHDRKYARRWRYVDGDHATNTPATFFTFSFLIDGDEMEVDVNLLLCPVHFGAHLLRGGPWAAPLAYEDLVSMGAHADWIFTAEASQLDPGDTTTGAGSVKGTASTTRRFTHLTDAPQGGWPFLTQQAALAARFAISGSTTSFEGDRYVSREGQLYRSDLPLLTEVRLTMRLSPHSNLLPLRMKITAELVTENIEWKGSLADYLERDTINQVSRLRMVCVGASLFQRGESLSHLAQP